MKLIVTKPFVSYPFHVFFVKKCRARDNSSKRPLLYRRLHILLPASVSPFHAPHFRVSRFLVCRLLTSFIHSYPVTKRRDSELACREGASKRQDRKKNSKSIDWSGFFPQSPQCDRRMRFSKFANGRRRALEVWGTLLRYWRASLRVCLWSFHRTLGWIESRLDTTMNLATESICVLASQSNRTSVQRAFAERSGVSGRVPFRLRHTHNSFIQIS